MSIEIRPFHIEASDEQLADLKRRLLATRWPDKEPVTDWSQGMPLGYTQELCRYWAESYDWRAREARLNRRRASTASTSISFMCAQSMPRRCRWS